MHLAVEHAPWVVVEQQAVRAEQLEADLAGQLLDLGVVDARDRRFDRRHRPRRLHRDRAVVQELGRLDAHRQRRQPGTHRGILGEWPAVDHCLTGVLHEVLEHAVGSCVARDADAFEGEPLPHQGPALVLVAEAHPNAIGLAFDQAWGTMPPHLRELLHSVRQLTVDSVSQNGPTIERR